MANRNSDLYRWKRWSTKDTPSSSAYSNTRPKSHVPPTDNIQDWIKKVEKASDRAAAVTFGLGNSRHGDGYPVANSYGTAVATLEAVRDHDEAHSEAQDLLSQWMAQKCGIDEDEEDDLRYFEDGVDVADYSASKKAGKSDLKDQWNNLLAENDPLAADPYNNISSEELYHQIETRDDDQSVQSIMDNLMKKDIVESRFKKDLGIGEEAKKKRKDPRTTMAARQQKVKENREKRQQLREAQMRQQQQHKDAQCQARQMVMKEERGKVMQRQREEALLQQEMARLRKDMQEQRRQEEESRQREKEIHARKYEELRQEEVRRRQEELQTRLNAESLIQEEKRKMEEKLENTRVMKAGQDLKSLQRHFQAWYQLVLSKRLALGKARAVADWRMLLRAWNAWRAYVRASWAERETREIEEDFRDLHRKKQIASDHYRRKILRKYLSVWCLWLRQEHQSRELEQQQHQTKTKMAAFLEAAASGKLWTKRSEEEGDGDARVGKQGTADRPDSVAQKLDDLFGEPACMLNLDASASSTARSEEASVTSDVSRTKRQPSHTAGPSKPKYAWQVMRKHVDLPVEEILAAGDDEDDEQQPNRNQNNAVDTAASVKPGASGATSKRSIGYKSNTFEHRYAAQQRILQEQQQQLREQKRLIEDLQTTQRQQQLRMQLRGGAEASSVATADPTELSEGLPDSGRSQPGTGTTPSTARSDHSDSSTASVGTKNKEPTRPPLLKGMKDREVARMKMKAEREERQRKREQEKLAEIKAKEERQRQVEEDEKKAKTEKRREEKRLAKQRELEKQQRVEHLQLQNSRADEHYRQTLLRHKGLDPWIRLVRTARQNMQVAEDHYGSVLQRKCLLPWRQYADEVVREKVAMAGQQYEVILLRRAFQSLKRYGHLQSIQLQKARRHYAFTLKGKVFQAWQKHVTDEKLRMWNHEEIAQEHNEIRRMKTTFLAWKRYPQMLKAERARDKRLEDMRKKVASILPDFGDS